MIQPTDSDGGGVPSPRGNERPGAEAGGGTRPPTSHEESPGVPGFRTWRGVYWFVFACFIGGVVALTIFARVFA